MDAETQGIQEILDKPWDVCNPGDTIHTKRVSTFLRFLEQADSKYYELEMDAVQLRVVLFGPNANILVFRANREWWQGTSQISTPNAKMLVEGLMHHPKAMTEKRRTLLAAVVALFLGLDKRVR